MSAVNEKTERTKLKDGGIEELARVEKRRLEIEEERLGVEERRLEIEERRLKLEEERWLFEHSRLTESRAVVKVGLNRWGNAFLPFPLPFPPFPFFSLRPFLPPP